MILVAFSIKDMEEDFVSMEYPPDEQKEKHEKKEAIVLDHFTFVKELNIHLGSGEKQLVQ